MDTTTKIASASILGAIATLTGKYSLILIFVFVAIVLDCITGLIRSKIVGIPWTSEKGYKGMWKKVSLFMALTMGIFLDCFVPYLLNSIGIQIVVNLPFGMIVGCYIILNEIISVCENLYQSNPGIIPKWIMRLLVGARNKIDEMEDK